MIGNFVQGAPWDPFEVIENFFWGEYLGPWTDLEKAGAPISKLDALAKIHDYSYARAEKLGGRRERVEKTKADYELAFTTENNWVAWGLFTQATVRVFTFNAVDLPW